MKRWRSGLSHGRLAESAKGPSLSLTWSNQPSDRCRRDLGQCATTYGLDPSQGSDYERGTERWQGAVHAGNVIRLQPDLIRWSGVNSTAGSTHTGLRLDRGSCFSTPNERLYPL
jgi:hypothetical protein